MSYKIGTAKIKIDINKISGRAVDIAVVYTHMDGKKDKPVNHHLFKGDTLTLSVDFNED